MKSIVSFLLLQLICFSSICQESIPDGWVKAGSTPKAYEIGIDREVKFKKEQSAYIRSSTSKGFGTLMQTFIAREYLGEKVRFSAYVKSEDIKGWGGLWMRVDAKEDKKTLSFDNMQDRPINGTTEWTQYEIVLEVPKESGWISYGLLLDGNGKIWIDDIVIEKVDSKVKTTESNHQRPYNTDFEY